MSLEPTRAFFNHLLISSLDRALTLAKMNSFALSVSEDLDFNMMARWIVFLNEKVAALEQSFALVQLA